jgi:hypothetical protein
MMTKVVEWLIQNSWFKKYSAMVGGVCLGMWISANYTVQIRATLAAWGISNDQYMNILLTIIAAAGITTSIGLSVVKEQRAKKSQKKDNPQVNG